MLGKVEMERPRTNVLGISARPAAGRSDQEPGPGLRTSHRIMHVASLNLHGRTDLLFTKDVQGLKM